MTFEVSEIDLWRAAQLLVASFGEAAEEEASTRADECYAEGDDETDQIEAQIWNMIAARVHELQQGKPGIYLH